MSNIRCNCDASCGENRYHDVGDPGCRYKDNEDYYRQYPRMRPTVLEIEYTDDDLEWKKTRWGEYEVLLETSSKGMVTKTKLLTINPGKNISKQYHSYRQETWFIVSGEGKLLVSDALLTLYPKQKYFIPLGAVHQVKNTGTEPLVILEIQEGTYCREDDIMRLQESWDESK